MKMFVHEVAKYVIRSGVQQKQEAKGEDHPSGGYRTSLQMMYRTDFLNLDPLFSFAILNGPFLTKHSPSFLITACVNKSAAH